VKKQNFTSTLVPDADNAAVGKAKEYKDPFPSGQTEEKGFFY